MPNAYETWRETKNWRFKRHVTKEGAAHLDAVLEALQPAALKDYLSNFADTHVDWNDQMPMVDQDDVQEFLAGLDELRAPSSEELRRVQDDLKTQAWKALEEMKRLNWTGEHTYVDALNDAKQVLGAIFRGEPFPKLERFRCPSLYGAGKNQVRCQYQLPHGTGHHWESDGKGVDWTDEQSVNPPKNYDEPVKPTDAQLDKLAAEVFGGTQCPSMWGTRRCELPSKHIASSPHLDGNATWPPSYETGVVCGNRALHGQETCDLPAGHSGRHMSSGPAPLSWPNGTGSNPDPINRPLTSSRCGASIEYSAADKGVTLYCKFKEGHDGKHEAPTGETFEYTERGQ